MSLVHKNEEDVAELLIKDQTNSRVENQHGSGEKQVIDKDSALVQLKHPMEFAQSIVHRQPVRQVSAINPLLDQRTDYGKVWKGDTDHVSSNLEGEDGEGGMRMGGEACLLHPGTQARQGG